MILLFAVAVALLWSVLNPPTTLYMMQESKVLGGVDHQWVPMDKIAPVMARSAVAAEDANYCMHWGLDVVAIRKVIASGGGRGASTISQQVVKNVYLWHGRSWLRKAMEAVMTPLIEAVWSKRRILEAAARHYFDVSADNLSGVQAARLAALLPAPKQRSASKPSSFVRKRATQIQDGAATIQADGRADCFES